MVEVEKWWLELLILQLVVDVWIVGVAVKVDRPVIILFVVVVGSVDTRLVVDGLLSIGDAVKVIVLKILRCDVEIGFVVKVDVASASRAGTVV